MNDLRIPGALALLGLGPAASGQVGASYCSAEPNSTGGPSAMSATGSTVAWDRELVLACDALPASVLGYFLVGTTEAFTPLAGGSSGNLCIGGTIGRYADAVLVADAAGHVELPSDPGSLPNGTTTTQALPGETFRFQFWHRDTTSGGASTSNFSDGLAVTFDAPCEPAGGVFPHPEFESVRLARGVEMADMDGDGDLDLVGFGTSGTSDGLVALHRNTGNATFEPVVWIDTLDGAYFGTVADVDADGLPDYVVVSLVDDEVAIQRNEGTGAVLSTEVHATGDGPIGITAGDVDGDGDLDLAIACLFGNGLSLLLNRGDGTFDPPVLVPTPPDPRGVALGDLTGNGLLDAVVAHATNGAGVLSVVPNLGGGTFGAALPTTPINNEYENVRLGDLNGDGLLDIASQLGRGGDAVVHLNLGGGALSPRILVRVGALASGVTLSDVDLDGDLDFVTGSRDREWVTVTRNRGDATFDPRETYSLTRGPIATATGDVDGDGDVDIAAALFDKSALTLLLDEGGGVYPRRAEHVIGGDPEESRVVDVDGDGHLDVVTVHELGAAGGSGRVSILYGNGQGGFPDLVDVAVGRGSTSLELADMDGDGDLDLVTADLFDHTVSVVMNAGSRTFDPPIVLGAPFAEHLELVDLDGNGTLDVVAASIVNFWTFTNDGNGTFSTFVGFGAAFNGEQIAAEDLDGDGVVELAIVDRNSDPTSQDVVRVFRMQPGGTYAFAGEFPTGVDDRDLVARDLDGDGDVDFATVSFASEQVIVLRNDGTGQFGAPETYPAGPGPLSIQAADVDRDGDVDLLTTNPLIDGFFRNSVSVLRNRGDGTFERAMNFGVGHRPRQVCVEDVDEDGAVDLVTTNFGSLSVSILFGRCP